MCLPVIDICICETCMCLPVIASRCMYVCLPLVAIVAPTACHLHIYVCAYSHIDTCIFMHMYMYMCIDIRIYAYPVAVMGWHRSLLQKRPIKETTFCKRDL